MAVFSAFLLLLLTSRVLLVVRDEPLTIRIISARPATAAERRQYEQG